MLVLVKHKAVGRAFLTVRTRELRVGTGTKPEGTASQ